MAPKQKTRKISFERLVIGEQYERPYLVELWGFNGWQAIGRGVVTPRGENKIILFITGEQQKTLTQYQDHFDGDRLIIDGEKNHANDDRLINAKVNGDEIHLFYRDRHHKWFTYFGLVFLDDFTRRVGRPSRFSFQTSRFEALASSAIATEEETHGGVSGDWSADPEGKQNIVMCVRYERSRKNRARALAIHGTKCKCCGFDFNEFYGALLARDFIEVHHVQSVTIPNAAPNPDRDLIPVCSNCHSMLHRRRPGPMPVAELRKLIAKCKKASQ